MKVEVSEKRIVRAMGIFYKVNRKYPDDLEEALTLGKIYRDAGLDPFYAFDQLTNKFFVTSRENVNKKGH